MICTYSCLVFDFFFFKQKTAYEMRISDWSSDVCSSDLFAKRAGIQLNHIPYKGGAQALVDLRAGRIDFIIGNMPDFFNLIKSNDLIGIGYGGAQRLAELPQIPLIKEVVPEFNFSNWFALEIGRAHV